MATKAEWQEGQYGLMYLDLPGQFRATVMWDSLRRRDGPEEAGYKATFENFTLKRRFGNADEAKKMIVKLARIKLTEALAALPEEE